MRNRYDIKRNYGIEVIQNRFTDSDEFWTPKESEAILWFDGQKKLRRKNGHVESWTSRSEYKQRAFQPNASIRPHVETLNGENVVSFVGDQSHLTLGDDYVYPIGVGFTVATLLYVPEDPSQFGWVFDFGNFPENGYGLSVTNNDVTFYTPEYVDGSVSSFTHRKAGTWQILLCEVEYGLVQRIGFVDNFPYAEDRINLTQIDTHGVRNESERDEMGGPFTIGGKSEIDQDQYFNGSIAELFIIPTTDNYYQSVSVNYLQSKWNQN